MGNLTAKDEATQRELIPARTYFGIICAIIDLGTQPSDMYAPSHKIAMGIELHSRKGPVMNAANTFQHVIWKDYALKFSKIPNRTPAALRVALESLLNREFTEAEAKVGYDLEKLIGMACKVQIKHETKNGKTYDQLASLLPIDDDDDVTPKANQDHVYYELDPKAAIPSEVPPWIGKKIMNSSEWRQANGGPDPTETAYSTSRPRPAREPGDDDDDLYKHL